MAPKKGVAVIPLKGVEPRSPNQTSEGDRNVFSLSRIGQLFQCLPRAAFDKIVQQHDGDRYVKRFGCQKLLTAMVCAQITGSRSLRELETLVNQHRNHHYHLGIEEVSRSTIAEACGKRKPVVFEDLAKLLMQLAGQAVRKQREEMLYLLDSTCIPLAGRGLQWAGELATRIPGLRLHLLYASVQQLPVYFTITGENVPDVTEGRRIALERGATYVFDKGYCDYGWWKRIDEAGACFVTRLKKNAAVQTICTRPLQPQAHNIVVDEEVTFKNTSNRGRHKNPYAGATLRRIEVIRDNGEVLTLVTNDLQSKAEDIAGLYKERWQIELFFKWIKQNLKIKKFFGQNENAIRIQLLTALITYLLILLFRAVTQARQPLRQIVDEIKTGPFHRPQEEASRWRRRRAQQALQNAVQPGLFR